MNGVNLTSLSISAQDQDSKSLSGKSLSADDAKTFVIFGIPRGGTTMVARVVESLGVNLGCDLPGNYEDSEFNFDLIPKELKTNRPVLIDRLASVVVQRNRDFQVWGWKYPRAEIYLWQLISKLRNPHLICVMRDPVASGIRHIKRYQNKQKRLLRKGHLVSDKDLATIPQRVLSQHLELQLKNIQIIEKSGCPSFICSYEKAVMKSDEFVREMAEFLGILSTEEQIKHAILQINPGGYL